MAIRSLLRRLQNQLAPEVETSSEQRLEAVRTATASILLEIAWADESISNEEEESLVGHLSRTFELTEEAARELVERAEDLRTGSIDHFAATNTIRRNTTQEQRMEIVRMMWRLVYADGRLHQYENYLVRKIADLLGIEHHLMIEAKLAVKDELNR